jgi:hypothetical protein
VRAEAHAALFPTAQECLLVLLLLMPAHASGHMLYTYIDAGEIVTRSYAAFLFKIPPNYWGVERVTYQAILPERGACPERGLPMTVGNLFSWRSPPRRY